MKPCLSVSNNIVSTKIYDKRDDFDFKIVNFTFLDNDVLFSTSYRVNISYLIQLARASSHATYFNIEYTICSNSQLQWPVRWCYYPNI